MTSSDALRRILADNDPRNGSIATRIIRALEDHDDERQPDEDGLYQNGTTKAREQE